MKYLLFIVLLVAILITAGCVGGNKETVVTITPTPNIVYVTVIVTPTQTLTDKVTPVATSTISDNEMWDKKFLDYMEKNGVDTKIRLLRQTPNINTAKELNKILVDGPTPASPKLKQYRSVLMDALGNIDELHQSFYGANGIDEAKKLYAEYVADSNGMAPTTTSFDVDIVPSYGGIQITSLMKGEHNFTVKYDVYNGQIKTSNQERSTPKLFTGETAQVILDCYDCTNTIFRGIQTYNETSMKMENVRYNSTEWYLM